MFTLAVAFRVLQQHPLASSIATLCFVVSTFLHLGEGQKDNQDESDESDSHEPCYERRIAELGHEI